MLGLTYLQNKSLVSLIHYESFGAIKFEIVGKFDTSTAPDYDIHQDREFAPALGSHGERRL